MHFVVFIPMIGLITSRTTLQPSGDDSGDEQAGFSSQRYDLCSRLESIPPEAEIISIFSLVTDIYVQILDTSIDMIRFLKLKRNNKMPKNDKYDPRDSASVTKNFRKRFIENERFIEDMTNAMFYLNLPANRPGTYFGQ